VCCIDPLNLPPKPAADRTVFGAMTNLKAIAGTAYSFKVAVISFFDIHDPKDNV
jgi:hypothetical protein